THLPGGVEEYLARVAESAAPTPPSASRSEADRDRQERAPTSAGAQRAARKELARLERRLEKLTTREAELQEQLAAHATDYSKLTELTGQWEQAKAERVRVEEEWLALAEQLSDS